uniref:Uncharacterized protein n=1 Tax=Setaria italica TaxID=4555 RepID=K3Y401_SETIT
MCSLGQAGADPGAAEPPDSIPRRIFCRGIGFHGRAATAAAK